jgi:hypothetical protein
MVKMVAAGTPNHPPILVVALGPLQASVTLFFDLLPLEVRHMVRVVFSGDETVREQIVVARAVIFVRGLLEYEELIAFAKAVGTPMYHYCDDNFIVVGEEAERYGANYAFYTRENMRGALLDFAGCLLSVPNLVDFYRENQLHPHVYLYPPIAAFEEYGEAPHDYPDERPFTFSFFGGGDRHHAFVSYIVPAIKQLSKTRPIDLVAFGVAIGAVDCQGYPNLQVFYPPYESDYTLAIRQFRHYSPSVMLHSSSSTRNNAFKNCNNIINGVLVGAAMICSTTEPYLDLDSQDATLLANDSEQGWYLAMWQTMNSRARLQQLRAGAKKYCESIYSGMENTAVINTLLKAHPPLDLDALAERWSAAATFVSLQMDAVHRHCNVLKVEVDAGAHELAEGAIQQHHIRVALHDNIAKINAFRIGGAL